jgi:hypothetical protein
MLFSRRIDDLHDQGYGTLVFAWPGDCLKVGPASDDRSRQNLSLLDFKHEPHGQRQRTPAWAEAIIVQLPFQNNLCA